MVQPFYEIAQTIGVPITRSSHHHSCARGWESAYSPQIQHFREIVGLDVATKETIDLDCDDVSIK